MKVLLLNQTFHPDVMATGQLLTDLAVRLAERGHEVSVVTSRRAYDQPEVTFPKRETWRGIRIHRIGSTGFGKGARLRRAADFASFLLLCAFRLIITPRQDAVVALTSPPLISFLGAAWAKFRGRRFFYWVMDFNPDEAIAAGWLRSDSLAARVLDWMSRFSLRRAHRIIALDRFMRERIIAKGIAPAKVLVIPPWSHDVEVKFDAEGRERFRKAHKLDGKFVVMYSGNHSPCHPLETLLAAARQVASHPDVAFCFVGGGSEWRKIKEQLDGRGKNGATPSNLVCLPYQPLAQLASSLSGADLHVVVMGEPFVGLVHPCKIYNVLSVAAPVLYIGPRPSHLSEILQGLGSEYPSALVAHGEVDRVVQYIQWARLNSAVAKRQAPTAICSLFSREALLPKLVAELEAG